MAKSVKSRKGRIVAGLVLVSAVVGLVILLQTANEQHSWSSTEAVVQERIKSGKNAKVRVEFPLPGGGTHVTTLSENGSIHETGTRVEVRYDLEDGKVVDAALADNDQGFWVMGVMLGVVILGSVVMNLVVWSPARPTPEQASPEAP
ncbi:DUF3592 domain-containing protein [Lentzea sp. NPDC058450]|uniref:DUF3592 domain-containing protein n=1 Tax=Lentzea sp. NPDC058450 TaxID=3346505 RepID=UPI003667B9EE